MHCNLRLASTLLLLFAASIGCDDEEPTPSVSIGVDIDGFVAIEQSEILLLEPGIQGGHHVDLAIRVDDIEAAGALLELDGVDADTGESLFVSVVRQLSPAEVEPYGDHWIRFDERFVWTDADPTRGEGRRVRIDATVTDATGEKRAEASVEVAIGYPTLTIGVDAGGLQFDPSLGGEDIELVSGIQLSYHLEVALLANHVEVDGAILSVSGVDADTSEVLTVTSLKVLNPNRVTQDGTSWIRFGEVMFVLSDDPLDTVGRRVRIEATVTDPLSDRVAADSVTMNIVDNVAEL